MSSPAPKVSVCVPVCNRAPHVGADIERALDEDSTESKSSSLGIPCSHKRSLELARAPYKAWLDSNDRMAQRLLLQHFSSASSGTR